MVSSPAEVGYNILWIDLLEVYKLIQNVYFFFFYSRTRKSSLKKNKKTLQILEVTLDAQVMTQSEIHVWNTHNKIGTGQCTHESVHMAMRVRLVWRQWFSLWWKLFKSYIFNTNRLLTLVGKKLIQIQTFGKLMCERKCLINIENALQMESSLS